MHNFSHSPPQLVVQPDAALGSEGRPAAHGQANLFLDSHRGLVATTTYLT